MIYEINLHFFFCFYFIIKIDYTKKVEIFVYLYFIIIFACQNKQTTVTKNCLMEVNNTYHNFLEEILCKGKSKGASRDQSEGTLEAFGLTTPMIFDLSSGIPVISTKKIWVKGITKELLWFLKGSTNVKDLREDNVHIWDGNAYDLYKRMGGSIPESDFFSLVDAGATGTLKLPGQKKVEYTFGNLNRMYGYQWRRKRIVTINDTIETIDPLAIVIQELLSKPNSRQIVLNTYDQYDASISALPPCHTMPLMFNCYPLSLDERRTMAEDILHEPVFTYNDRLFDDMMIPKYHLNAEMIQRSGDAFLGVPFNITSTALLITIIAEICNMVPGNFIHHILSAHIYNNHLDQIKEQLSRNTNIQDTFDCSILWGDDMYVPRDILVDYKTPNNIIKAEMIV